MTDTCAAFSPFKNSKWPPNAKGFRKEEDRGASGSSANPSILRAGFFQPSYKTAAPCPAPCLFPEEAVWGPRRRKTPRAEEVVPDGRPFHLGEDVLFTVPLKKTCSFKPLFFLPLSLSLSLSLVLSPLAAAPVYGHLLLGAEERENRGGRLRSSACFPTRFPLVLRNEFNKRIIRGRGPAYLCFCIPVLAAITFTM